MTAKELRIIKNIIIEKYKKGKSLASLGREYNSTHSVISKILKENNIELRNSSESKRKYKINEHCFDLVETEEQFYFLGFFFADGYNDEKRGKLILTINSDDVDLLENFKKIFNYTGPIKYSKSKINNNNYLIREQVSLKLSSKILSKRFKELGCHSKKSLSLEFPDYIPDELLKHFIRGYFDGDGCIYLKDKKHNYLGVKIIMCDKFANVFVQKMKEQGFNFNTQSPKECNEHTKNVYLSRQKDVKNFLDWIYQNSSIRCERKYHRYYNFYYGDGNITPYKIPTGKILSSEK